MNNYPPKSMKPGQVWNIRPEFASEIKFIQILMIEEIDGQDIIHIAALGEDLIPLVYHLPFCRDAVSKSVGEVFLDNHEALDFSEGYDLWRSEFDAGEAGVFSRPVFECIIIAHDHDSDH